jgi:uncharacterized protein YcnI
MTARPSALRRVLVVAGSAAALSLLTPAVSAWSDVSVAPTQATHGGSAGVTFRVTNASRSASMTRVTIHLPEATPIGEVYPYSVPGWAPKMSMRTLRQPSQSGSGISRVAAAVEWNAFPGKAPKPGEVAELSLSLNPIPVADRLVFTVIETYSDGTVVRWGAAGGTGSPRPGPVIELVSPANRDQGADISTQTAAADSTDGPSPLLFVGGLVAGLAAAAAFAWLRRRVAPNTSAADAEDPAAPADNGYGAVPGSSVNVAPASSER